MERNARIFHNSFSDYPAVIVKIILMILSWIDAAPDVKKARLENPAATAKRSLDFLRQHPGSGDE